MKKNFVTSLRRQPGAVLNQDGQTLIETVVAIFILVMGIVASLGLAIYSLNASTNINKQIIAIGLAREGIEAVKNMRDTNWLKLTMDTNCYDYTTGSSNASCYKSWLTAQSCSAVTNSKGYCMDPGGLKSYRLAAVNDASKKIWDFNNANNKWGLDLDTNASGNGFSGFYIPNTSQNDGSSDFYRQITLDTSGANSSAPFNQDPGPRLQVTVDVWWVDKKCPRVQTYTPGMRCSVELKTFLTNWKNYTY